MRDAWAIVNAVLVAAAVGRFTVVDDSAAFGIHIERIVGIACAVGYSGAVVVAVLIASTIVSVAVVNGSATKPIHIESEVGVAFAMEGSRAYCC